jgi:hypothetical protein
MLQMMVDVSVVLMVDTVEASERFEKGETML